MDHYLHRNHSLLHQPSQQALSGQAPSYQTAFYEHAQAMRYADNIDYNREDIMRNYINMVSNKKAATAHRGDISSISASHQHRHQQTAPSSAASVFPSSTRDQRVNSSQNIPSYNDLGIFSSTATTAPEQVLSSNQGGINYAKIAAGITPFSKNSHLQQQQLSAFPLTTTTSTASTSLINYSTGQSSPSFGGSFEDSQIFLDTISREVLSLQQICSTLEQNQLLQLSRNSGFIGSDHQQQRKLIWQNREVCLHQINQLNLTKTAFLSFKRIFPEASSQSFLALPQASRLMFLSQAAAATVPTVNVQLVPRTVTIDKQPSISGEVKQEEQQYLSTTSIASLIKHEEEQRTETISSSATAAIDHEIPQSPVVVEHTLLQQSTTVEPIQPESSALIGEAAVLAITENKDIEEEEEVEEEEEEDLEEGGSDECEESGFEDKTEQGSSNKPLLLSNTTSCKSDKRSGKRFSKLQNFVEQILARWDSACSKISPIALSLCLKVSLNGEVLRHRSYEATAAAIIVHASREVANPITVKSISKLTSVKEKIINRVFMYLKKNVEGFHNKMPQPEVFVKNFCEKMQLSDSIYTSALALLGASLASDVLKGQHAATVAACLVKLSAQLHGVCMTVKQICEASNVCQISLRLLYRTIYPRKDELLSNTKLLSLNSDIAAFMQTADQHSISMME